MITRVAGEAASSNVQLQELTLTKKPRGKVPLTYRRGGSTHTADVTLGTQP